MWSLCRAEWQKLNGNLWVTSFLVWIFPIGTLTFLSLAVIGYAFSSRFQEIIRAAPPNWPQQTLLFWAIVNSTFGRLVLVIFAAEVFGGEYQRSMWKNLLPRRSRASIILAKFLTMTAMITLAFISASLISGIMSGVVAAVAGATYGPDFNAETLSLFLPHFAAQAFISIAAALIAACYAALGAMLARTFLGALLFGVVATLAEQAIFLVLMLLSNLLQAPGLIAIYKFTPGYNLSNLSSWDTASAAYTFPLLDQNAGGGFSAEVSLVLTLIWLVDLVGLTIILFRRQDVMT
ncbi:MAG: ABC transporter permease [Anaerolineae bacterium]|nr:ABC transporter permease [Anaerolineae bacterium]